MIIGTPPAMSGSSHPPSLRSPSETSQASLRTKVLTRNVHHSIHATLRESSCSFVTSCRIRFDAKAPSKRKPSIRRRPPSKRHLYILIRDALHLTVLASKSHYFFIRERLQRKSSHGCFCQHILRSYPFERLVVGAKIVNSLKAMSFVRQSWPNGILFCQ